MTEIIGTVVDVFLPNQYRNGSLLDVMDRTTIGFKIKTKDGFKKIILKQNKINAQIMKNDVVKVIIKNISGKRFIDIKQYSEVNNTL